MDYQAWFECIRCSAKRYPLDQVIYECDCGGLLEVRHDMEALRKKPGAAWRNLYDKRYMRTDWPYGSGVWSVDYSPWSSMSNGPDPVLDALVRAGIAKCLKTL